MIQFDEFYIHKEKNKEITLKKVIIRTCTLGDIENILILQNNVLENIDNKEIFQPSTKEDLIKNVSFENETIGCFLDGFLIAYAILDFPGQGKDNLGYDINIDFNGKGHTYIAHFDTIAVHPDYRGNGLQKHIGRLIEKRAGEKGAKYLCATVSPLNHVSLKNFLESGYEIKAEKIKYCGKNRYIVVKAI